MILAPTRVTLKRHFPSHSDWARAKLRALRIGVGDCFTRYERAAGDRDPLLPGAVKLSTILVGEVARPTSPVTRPGVRP